MIGGPCDVSALAVASQIMLTLPNEAPVTVTVSWEAEPWQAYRYQVRLGERHAVQYVTALLLAQVRNLDAIREEVQCRVMEADSWR